MQCRILSLTFGRSFHGVKILFPQQTMGKDSEGSFMEHHIMSLRKYGQDEMLLPTAASSQGQRLQEKIGGYTRDMNDTKLGGTIVCLSLG